MLELKLRDRDREVVLQFEHSLLSLSKWESKNKKPFMSIQRQATDLIDYFQDMLLTPGIDPQVVYELSPAQLEELANYINDSQTASSVPNDAASRPSNEQLTSELIYAWMVGLEIDFRAEAWHLNRLMMLIQIVNYKRQPPKKRKPAEVWSDWQQENERRKKFFKSKG